LQGGNAIAAGPSAPTPDTRRLAASFAAQGDTTSKEKFEAEADAIRA
jgi:hypothetical protein